MKESATYQAIVAEGRAQEARDMVLRAATNRFGPPDAASRAALEAVADRATLEALMDRLFQVDGWPALVADLPRRPPRRRNGTPRGN